jgi:UDPglucose 6-dehydrogenase
MAQLGHNVVGIDVDAKKIALLSAGKTPFYEPGFAELLRECLAEGRLSFSTDMAAAVGADVHFLCVGTPQSADSLAADLRYVHAAMDSLGAALGDSPPTVVAGKSTVPVGTARALAEKLKLTSPNATLVWNPEFLREGFAVKDTIQPDRIVYGLAPGGEGQWAAGVLDQVYAPILARETPKIETDYETAELVKVSANSFLAMKISFINAIARVCDATGANVKDLAGAIGIDDRIGKKFLRAGIGFGGGCLPKDIRAFATRAAQLGGEDLAELLGQIDRINLGQRSWTVELVSRLVGPDLAGKTVGVLGAAFKPDTDDTRDSPALAIAAALVQRGAIVRIYDPAEAALLPAAGLGVEPTGSVAAAVGGAQAVLVLTEWAEFKELDPASLNGLVEGRTVIDGRNALDAQRWRAAGWDYHGIGTR